MALRDQIVKGLKTTAVIKQLMYLVNMLAIREVQVKEKVAIAGWQGRQFPPLERTRNPATRDRVGVDIVRWVLLVILRLPPPLHLPVW